MKILTNKKYNELKYQIENLKAQIKLNEKVDKLQYENLCYKYNCLRKNAINKLEYIQKGKFISEDYGKDLLEILKGDSNE